MQPILTWLNDNSEERWRSIEKYKCPVSVKAIPFCKKHQKRAQVTDSRLIRNTLKTWGRMKRNCEMRDYLTVLREIKEDPEFTPNTQDTAFNTWAQKGLTMFGNWKLE